MTRKVRFWPYENTLKRLYARAYGLFKPKPRHHVVVPDGWNVDKALRLADDLERVYNTIGGPLRLQAAHCIRWLVMSRLPVNEPMLWYEAEIDAGSQHDDSGRGGGA